MRAEIKRVDQVTMVRQIISVKFCTSNFIKIYFQTTLLLKINSCATHNINCVIKNKYFGKYGGYSFISQIPCALQGSNKAQIKDWKLSTKVILKKSKI